MKVTIDRFEEEIAVLITRDDPPRVIDVPREFLPDGCEEGDILDVHICRDIEGTEAARKRVSGLIEKLKKKSTD